MSDKILSYKYKFYLDAYHKVWIGEKYGEIHPHTWEIAIEVMHNNMGELIRFNELETIVKNILKPFQNVVLNDVKPFDVTCPYTEEIGEFFYGRLLYELETKNWNLKEFAISESPNRTYIINNLYQPK